MRLTSTSNTRPVKTNSNNKGDVNIQYICKKEGAKYFNLYSGNESKSGVYFVLFSDKVSPTIASYNILTFYISFIYIIGQVIRTFFSKEEEKIIFTEIPETNELINLCEGIKLSRNRKEFHREEYLYYIMIDFMRSPEILKILTRSSITWFKEKKMIDNGNSTNKVKLD